MGGCGLDGFPTPRPFWSLCTLSGPAPFPAPPLARHYYSALVALCDLGSAPRSPLGAECSITNQRLRAGLRLFKSRPPPLILVVSVRQPQSHAARLESSLSGHLAPLSIFPRLLPICIWKSDFLSRSRNAPSTPSRAPVPKSPRSESWDHGSRSPGVRHPGSTPPGLSFLKTSAT